MQTPTEYGQITRVPSNRYCCNRGWDALSVADLHRCRDVWGGASPNEPAQAVPALFAGGARAAAGRPWSLAGAMENRLFPLLTKFRLKSRAQFDETVGFQISFNLTPMKEPLLRVFGWRLIRLG